MAVSRKAMTEGIRTSTFPGTPRSRSFTIPQSKIKDFCQLPLHKGAVGAPAPVRLLMFLRRTGKMYHILLVRNDMVFDSLSPPPAGFLHSEAG